MATQPWEMPEFIISFFWHVLYDALDVDGWIRKEPAAMMPVTTVYNSSTAVVGEKIKGKLNAEHESVGEYFVYFYIINCNVCRAGIRTGTLYYTKQIEPLKSWPDHDFACFSGTHLQPKPRDMTNKRKYTCLLCYIRAEPAGCLTVSLRGGRVFTMLSSCLAVREHFFPDRDPIWTAGGESPQGYSATDDTQDGEWASTGQRRSAFCFVFFFLTNKWEVWPADFVQFPALTVASLIFFHCALHLCSSDFWFRFLISSVACE